ncbi:MAG: histidine phosphatase family protein [Candidatus Eremiobacteraeota bacterium]|nr:histidine phosphatase family protein [Candidatus Eremiobacteraeota bacterium]
MRAPSTLRRTQRRLSSGQSVFIARHGETTWNITGRYQGRLESPLSALGVAQAQRLAESLASHPLKRIISSPLGRCVATARIVAEKFGLTVETDPLLIEIAHGSWEGRYRDELAANDPERYRQWRHQPEIVQFENGESIRDVLARWRRFVSGFHPSEDTLLVSHDAVVRVALVDLLKRPLSEFWKSRVMNGAYAWFQVNGSKWEVVRECVSDHLAGLVADPSTQAL